MPSRFGTYGAGRPPPILSRIRLHRRALLCWHLQSGAMPTFLGCHGGRAKADEMRESPVLSWRMLSGDVRRYQMSCRQRPQERVFKTERLQRLSMRCGRVLKPHATSRSVSNLAKSARFSGLPQATAPLKKTIVQDFHVSHRSAAWALATRAFVPGTRRRNFRPISRKLARGGIVPCLSVARPAATRGSVLISTQPSKMM